MNMLDEGTKTRSALKINEEISNLGSQLSTGSNLDQCFVILNSLKANLKPSLEIFADVVLNPSFPQADLDRLKKEQLVAIQREKLQPNSTALRILPKYLFGENHPYGLPFTGSGFESSINNISRESIVKFQQSLLVPNNATLIVVGDITMDEIKPQIEALFKTWKPGNIEKLTIATVNIPSKPVIYLMDRPGSIQSIVMAGNLSGKYGELDEPTVSVMNSIIGGEFTSRINMNIREDKHWSYGASSFLRDTRGQRPFIAYTQVQSDKTKETVQEIYKELSQFLKEKPATSEEVSKNQNNQFLQFAGKYETMSNVMWDINDILKYNLPDNYFQIYANKLKAMQVKDVQAAAKQVIKSDQLVWVVVGDKSKIEAPLKEIGYEIKMIDADGNLIK
jgi:zinc protease